MAGRNYLTEDVGRHLSTALALLADAFPHVCEARRAKLTRAAKTLHQVRQFVDWSTAEAEAARKAEMDAGGHGARWLTDDSAARAEATLASHHLGPAERRFANNLGELVVGIAYEAFNQTERQALGYDAACIPAAIAVALALVTEPAPTPQTNIGTDPSSEPSASEGTATSVTRPSPAGRQP
jgi:hypothetical protein